MATELNPNKYGKRIDCTVCGRQKQPRGRSVASEIAATLCSDEDCKGFYQEPRSGSLWTNESEADFGYPVSDEGTEIRYRIGDPETCPTCAPDNGKPMWQCYRSDRPDAEDAMPCICLCHVEARE